MRLILQLNTHVVANTIIRNNNNTILHIDPVSGIYSMQNTDGRMVQIAPDDLYLTDKYGNTTSLINFGLIYKQRTQFYYELYEYWSKTKEGVDYENTKN